MKKIIVLSFALIFLLFSVGSGVTIYYLYATTRDLNELIGLHEIKDIRQELSLNIQKIKAFVYASPGDFAKHLDSIIEVGGQIDATIRKCHSCHHITSVENEIEQVEIHSNTFQERLSFFITTVSEGEYRRQNQKAVADIGDDIYYKVEEMANRAAATIQRRTVTAMGNIDRAYFLLAATLLATFLIALFVARFLTKEMTEPFAKLLDSAHKIRDGELGRQIEYRGFNEFVTLINTFNEMNLALAVKDQRIAVNLARLDQLSKATLPLHTAHSMPNILHHVGLCIENLIDVEQKGILLVDSSKKKFLLHLSTPDAISLAAYSEILPLHQVVETFRAYKGKPIVLNKLDDCCWPIGEKPMAVKQFNGLLLVWLVVEKELVGALLAINKKKEDFSEEDVNVFEILANNISVAFENIELYKSLQGQMEELQQTQRQLFEAEKLTALGTLAGGVAHDFNNILCGMIGHLALIKRKMNPDSKEFNTLDMVEKAGFRAADLTKQLLTFSRQEILELRSVDLNKSIQHIVALLSNTISKLISINLELDDNLPLIMGDANQLEQVVMNLCVNSRDAMPGGGIITIRTEAVTLDEGKVNQYSWMRPGQHIRLTVIDNGSGIKKDVLTRIFEPFFTTKEFGQGTGLGLAIVYGIIKSHKGFCEVESNEGKGTSFSVYLPIADRLIKENPLAIAEWQKCSGTILIVDDELFVSTMLSEYLNSLGCVTYIAHNGEDGVSLFKEKQSEIEVVILDINMPIMDGKSAFDVMRKIKPDLKVIVSTGYGNEGLTKKMLDEGALVFVQKPYRLEVIARTISQVLGKGKGEEEPAS